MTAMQRFAAAAPDLLAAAVAHDPGLLQRVRQALVGLQHYDLPVGWKHVPYPVFLSTCWIGVFAAELASPNWFMNDWRRRKQLKGKWLTQFRRMVCRVEGVASHEGLELLGRAPRCYDRMYVQTVRLVPSVRNFIRDDDNSAFVTKQMSDALKEVGLIKEDRREWYTASPLLQDVSPITVPGRDKKGRTVERGVPVVVVILWPVASTSLLAGAPHVDRLVHPPTSRQVPTDHRRTEERRAVPDVRRRVRARAVDV